MSEYDWFRSRVLAHAAGLLPDDELERFEALRAEDARCAAAWSAFLEGDEGGADFHLPPGLVAQWPKCAQRLGELERGAIEHHLGHCESCAEDLALFGSATRPAARSQEARRPHGAAPRPARWRFALGGAAVGALATAALLLLMLRPAPGPQRDGSIPWAAPTRVRSDELPAFARVELDAGARQLALNLAVPSGLDASRAAVVEVFDPTGAMVERFPLTVAELQRAALLLLLDSPEAFAPGDYRVLFQQDAIEAELWFRVEHAVD